MPVLEDTVDFKVATLNDLLDADVRKGVPVAADDKYKRWAFLSTGLAGMLLVALILAVVTGGGDDGGGTAATEAIPAPPNTSPVDIKVGASLPTGIERNAKVSVLDQDNRVLSSGATVIQIKEAPATVGKGTIKTAVVAVSNDDYPDVSAVNLEDLRVRLGTLPKATTTTTAAPSTTPTPIEPAPATTPPS